MNNKEQLTRIARMEEIHDRCRAAVDALLQATEQYASIRDALRSLESYYQSPTWLADFDDERAGKFSQDMKRGILSEDTIYDLLTDKDRLLQLLKELANN